jgi:undecaprenyl diphosphate synthase
MRPTASPRAPPPRRHHGRQRPLGARRRAPRAIGHRAGARAVNLCIDFCLEQGIEALTLFAFSSENWGRPEDEVGALMKLFMTRSTAKSTNCTPRRARALHRRARALQRRDPRAHGRAPKPRTRPTPAAPDHRRQLRRR